MRGLVKVYPKKIMGRYNLRDLMVTFFWAQNYKTKLFCGLGFFGGRLEIGMKGYEGKRWNRFAKKKKKRRKRLNRGEFSWFGFGMDRSAGQRELISQKKNITRTR